MAEQRNDNTPREQRNAQIVFRWEYVVIGIALWIILTTVFSAPDHSIWSAVLRSLETKNCQRYSDLASLAAWLLALIAVLKLARGR